MNIALPPSTNFQKVKKLLILLGDKETGKTSVLQKLAKKGFEEKYKETCGKNWRSS